MIAAILLASGRGKRFGPDKLLYQVEGVSMAERAFRALPLDIPAFVVTGDSRVAALARQHENITVVKNADERDDIALTIRLGLQALPEDTTGALFCVCDQPWLTRQSVERLTEAFRAAPDGIYVLSYGERQGNPCLFPRKYFSELSALEPDQGGKTVIARHPEAVRYVQALNPGELEDLDRRPGE
ncbi:MAG: nucleotidyltransferase family protein [Oscillospiraceae bacterium]|nr:nucleotidyltransferase family protein [Oscillospiraceae bacterium]